MLRLIWQHIALGQGGGMRVNPMLEATGALEKLGLPVVRRTADVNGRFRPGELANPMAPMGLGFNRSMQQVG